MSFIQRIINHGLSDELMDWDHRNIRFMNTMVIILCSTMVMFSILILSFGQYENLPLTISSFILSASYFFIQWKFNLSISKIYFTILPTLMVASFSLLAVGKVGNDVYYLIPTSLIPLVLFKEKKFYLPLFLFNVLVFFAVKYLQNYIQPFSQLHNDVLMVYKTVNVFMMFIFTYAMLQLFKVEIFGYQSEIEEQKSIIEEQNIETRQSIEYAQKIQEAILPSSKNQINLLPNSFILYLPKDIVAGDFYWMEQTLHPHTKEEIIHFAVADCTGHGVPGAMVSIVCNNALNRAVREFNLVEPGAILDQTRKLVIETFMQSDREVKDGMDIGFCSYYPNQNKLLFAGANNGLYLIRKDELVEFKPNKEPIGLYDHASPFKTEEINLIVGDSIYLYTDGFADQFGGEKGKKYKYKPFKKLIHNLHKSSAEEQKKIIYEEFMQWKGELEQVDDICIMGVQF